MRDVARAFEPELHTHCLCSDHRRSAHRETPPAQGARDERGTDPAQLSQSPGQDARAGTLLNARFLSQLVLR